MELEQKIQACLTTYDNYLSEKERLEFIVNGLGERIQTAVNDRASTEQAWETLRALLDKFSANSIELLNEMLNKGVRAIFNDREYSIEINITDNKRKSMELFLLEKRNGTEVKSSIPEGIGGGVLVVVSFIFRVFLIRLYELRPFLLLDESFTQVSSSYLPNFMKFLRYLTNTMGFTFLFISHDPRIQEHMDQIYEISMGKEKLNFRNPNINAHL
jgi:DNA repair exonuclease SbcCD ATPase subunit